MIDSFKVTVFSWCKLHGIETMDEFLVSEAFFKDWLSLLSSNDGGEVDADVSHNAGVLLDFLGNNILLHKDRFLVCLRNDRLYLDYRSTSALESMFQKMKDTCNPRVCPSMSICTSMIVQNQQRQAKMDERRKEVFAAYNKTPLWAMGSQTKDKVTKTCESWVGQNASQHGKYNCRLEFHPEAGFYILLLRKEDELEYCLECTEEVDCRACSPNSPVTRFRRLRKIFFRPVFPGA